MKIALFFGVIFALGGPTLSSSQPLSQIVSQEILPAPAAYPLYPRVRDRVQGAYPMPRLGRYELALEVLDGLKQ